MAKVIALQSYSGTVAQHLRQHGYQIISLQQAAAPGQRVDALLVTGYRPDNDALSMSTCADITVGAGCSVLDERQTLTLNITGQKPEQVRTTLDGFLKRREM
jgi:hypothetical protein